MGLGSPQVAQGSAGEDNLAPRHDNCLLYTGFC